MTPPPEPRLLWVERLPPRPLCDVPWFGNAIVLSDGQVNFCCHSNGVAGNINDAPFEEIWNGAIMRGIRRELSAQRLPVLCQTPSCPIFRGDTRHFLLDRAGKTSSNPLTIGPEVRPQVTAWFSATRLDVRRRARLLRRPVLDLDLAIDYSGPHAFCADLFVGVAPAGGQVAFAPTGQRAPEPIRFDIGLGPLAPHHDLRLTGIAAPAGAGEICVALFIANANPLATNQCVWSTVVAA